MKFNKTIKRKCKPLLINTKHNSYYWWAAPLIPFVELYCYIEEKMYERRKWSEEKATKVLNKVLPKILEYVEEDNAFYYCMDWSPCSLYRKAPCYYYKWAEKFSYKLQRFIRDGYENEDYVKTIENDGYDVWVKFSEKYFKKPLDK